MRVCGQPGALHGGLAHGDALASGAPASRTDIRARASTGSAAVPRRWLARSARPARRARSHRRRARGSSPPSRGSRASRGGAPARCRTASRSARGPRRDVPAHCRRPSRWRLRQRHRGCGGCDEQPLSPTARDASRAARPTSIACIEVQPVHAVQPQLDLQRRGLRRVVVAQLVPRADQPAVASSWCPCQCSTAAHRAVSSTRRATASGSSSSVASSSDARQRSSSPTDRSADASATRTSTWRSASVSGSSRSAASNHRAAVAGARGAAARAGLEQQLDRVADRPGPADCSM